MASSVEDEEIDEVGSFSEAFEEKLLCRPCSKDKSQKAATGYCVNCQEYLCKRCFKVHLIPSLTRGHLLIKLDEMTMFERKESRITCQEHCDEEIRFHCESHSFLGCHICFYSHQKTCKNAVYIPDVSKDITTSEQFNNFNQNLSDIKKRCVELVANIKGKLQTVENDHSGALQAIKDFKQETIEQIYMIEREFVEKANKVKKKEIAKLEKLSGRCCLILNDTNKVIATIDMLQKRNRNSDIYTTLITSQENVFELKQAIQTAERKNRSKRFAFKANNGLTESLKKPWEFGVLNVTEDIRGFELVGEVSIQSECETTPCLITGSLILTHQKLVLTDFNHANTLKMLDMVEKELISTLKLSSGTWDACKIEDNLIAVTLPLEKKIGIIKTDPYLELDREIDVDGVPRGIGHSDGKLVVSFSCHNGKVEILNLEGNVKLTVESDEEGRALFNDPCHIAINPTNQLLYVSNVRGHNILCMDWNGTVVGKYRDDTLIYTGKAAFDSGGMVYICGNGLNSIQQLTEDCRMEKVLMGEVECVSHPMTIGYQENEGRLFVGQWIGDTLKEYKCMY